MSTTTSTVITPPSYKNTNHGKYKSLRYWLGMLIASCFSFMYFLAPLYVISCLLCWYYYSYLFALYYSIPFILSSMLPPIAFPSLLCYLQPICDYFDYEEIHELKPIPVHEEIFGPHRKQYLCILQPHGVISFGGICSAATGRIPDIGNKFPTAVADAILYTPILKHVLGIFGLISASKSSLIRRIRKYDGPEGCIVLYVGGMAELFLSSNQEETLYLHHRKGFIKLALQEGIDIIPVYLFGNTSVLSIYNHPMMASVSRKLQVSLTYIWGKYYLPIPRDNKILYVSGQPLGMPSDKNNKIPHPTQQQIDHWHNKYCQEVQRLYDTYKERVPEYKHKKLVIV